MANRAISSMLDRLVLKLMVNEECGNEYADSYASNNTSLSAKHRTPNPSSEVVTFASAIFKNLRLLLRPRCA